jgi:hypothetical protein
LDGCRRNRASTSFQSISRVFAACRFPGSVLVEMIGPSRSPRCSIARGHRGFASTQVFGADSDCVRRAVQLWRARCQKRTNGPPARGRRFRDNLILGDGSTCTRARTGSCWRTSGLYGRLALSFAPPAARFVEREFFFGTGVHTPSFFTSLRVRLRDVAGRTRALHSGRVAGDSAGRSKLWEGDSVRSKADRKPSDTGPRSVRHRARHGCRASGATGTLWSQDEWPRIGAGPPPRTRGTMGWESTRSGRDSSASSSRCEAGTRRVARSRFSASNEDVRETRVHVRYRLAA